MILGNHVWMSSDISLWRHYSFTYFKSSPGLNELEAITIVRPQS